MAMRDFGRLIEKKTSLTKSLQSYLYAHNGKYFILSRARFYEKLSLYLRDDENLEMAIYKIRTEHLRKRKTYLNEKIRYMEREGIITDKREIKKMIDWLPSLPSPNNNNNNNIITTTTNSSLHQMINDDNVAISMGKFKLQVFGPRSTITSLTKVEEEEEEKVVLTRAKEYDEQRGEYIQRIIKQNCKYNILKQDEEQVDQRGEYNLLKHDEEYDERRDLQFHCNEEMGAGIMMAAFRDGDGTILPVCVCTHPMYLTGPTCKHRTYNSVVDYELWEESGIPEFLTDPLNDYTKANNICQRTTLNTTAVFEERDGTFKCQPLAAHFAQSLQLRGPYEPALILDRDYVDAVNNNSNHQEGIKINIDYLDLLKKFW